MVCLLGAAVWAEVTLLCFLIYNSAWPQGAIPFLGSQGPISICKLTLEGDCWEDSLPCLESVPSPSHFSSVVSDSLWPRGLQHTRPPCPSPTPGACSKLMSNKWVMPSNHFILCHPLLILPSIFPSIRVFPTESVLRIRWPKYWSFSFSISPSNEYSGLISSSRSIPSPHLESSNGPFQVVQW